MRKRQLRLGRVLFCGYRYRYVITVTAMVGVTLWLMCLARSRYADTLLMNRMGFYASVLNLDKAEVASDLRLRVKLDDLASRYSLRYAGQDYPGLLKAVRSVVISQDHDEVREPLDNLKEHLQGYSDVPHSPTPRQPYEKLGVDPRVRQEFNVPLGDLREQAQRFVLFAEHGRYRPPQFYAFPWLYLDFYDYRRVQLNWIILGSIGALFFSVFLLLEAWYGGDCASAVVAVCPPACQPWSTCDPIARPRLYVAAFAIFAVLVAWALVFFLDDPERLNERPFDYAVAILTALLATLVIYFVHVSTRTPMIKDLRSTMTADEVVDRLQPVAWAILATLIGIGAGGYYTLFGLLPSGKYLRVTLQTVIFLALAAYLGHSLYRLYANTKDITCKAPDPADRAVRFGDHFHRLFLPKLRSALFKMVLAAVLYAAPLIAA